MYNFIIFKQIRSFDTVEHAEYVSGIALYFFLLAFGKEQGVEDNEQLFFITCRCSLWVPEGSINFFHLGQCIGSCMPLAKNFWPARLGISKLKKPGMAKMHLYRSCATVVPRASLRCCRIQCQIPSPVDPPTLGWMAVVRHPGGWFQAGRRESCPVATFCLPHSPCDTLALKSPCRNTSYRVRCRPWLWAHQSSAGPLQAGAPIWPNWSIALRPALVVNNPVFLFWNLLRPKAWAVRTVPLETLSFSFSLWSAMWAEVKLGKDYLFWPQLENRFLMPGHNPEICDRPIHKRAPESFQNKALHYHWVNRGSFSFKGGGTQFPRLAR